MKHAAIIWGDIVGVEEEAFLYWRMSVIAGMWGTETRCYIA